jgi:hypothetical protein
MGYTYDSMEEESEDDHEF